MEKRLSRGERKFIREMKAGTRQELERQTFISNENLALDVIQRQCFPDGMPFEYEKLIREYWEIRRTYFDENDEMRFKDEREEFAKKLDSKNDSRLDAALRVVSSNFARHPGR